MPKLEEPEMEIPDVLQGEIARLDSRFKVRIYKRFFFVLFYKLVLSDGAITTQ